MGRHRPPPRYGKARDACEAAIIQTLEVNGYRVQQINDTKEPGIPDLLVAGISCKGKPRTWLGECIGEDKWKKYRQFGGLSPAQTDWHLMWPDPIGRWRTPEEALRFVRETP